MSSTNRRLGLHTKQNQAWAYANRLIYLYNWIFNIKHHSELLQVYSNFAKMVETQFSKRIKIFQSNNALEYTQYAFQTVLHSYDNVHQLTCLSTSQQNGRVKRKFRNILDTVCALLLSTKVPAPFLGRSCSSCCSCY